MLRLEFYGEGGGMIDNDLEILENIKSWKTINWYRYITRWLQDKKIMYIPKDRIIDYRLINTFLKHIKLKGYNELKAYHDIPKAIACLRNSETLHDLKFLMLYIRSQYGSIKREYKYKDTSEKVQSIYNRNMKKMLEKMKEGKNDEKANGYI